MLAMIYTVTARPSFCYGDYNNPRNAQHNQELFDHRDFVGFVEELHGPRPKYSAELSPKPRCTRQRCMKAIRDMKVCAI